MSGSDVSRQRDDYSVTITEAGYIKLDRRLIKTNVVKKDMTAALEWEDSLDAVSVDLLRKAFPLDAESLPIIVEPDGKTAYIDARRFFHRVNLGSNVDTPLDLQFRLSDPNAHAFVLHLKEPARVALSEHP